MNSKLIIALVVLSVVMTASARIACPPDYCHMVKCGHQSKEFCEAQDEIFKEHGSMCGCCGVCLHKLKEGESCAALLVVGGPPSYVICDTGLVCNRTKGVCAKQ